MQAETFDLVKMAAIPYSGQTAYDKLFIDIAPHRYYRIKERSLTDRAQAGASAIVAHTAFAICSYSILIWLASFWLPQRLGMTVSA